jgi:hypothetical protein
MMLVIIFINVKVASAAEPAFSFFMLSSAKRIACTFSSFVFVILSAFGTCVKLSVEVIC